MTPTDVSDYIDLTSFPSGDDSQWPSSGNAIASTSHVPMEDADDATMLLVNDTTADSIEADVRMQALPSGFRQSAPSAAPFTMLSGGHGAASTKVTSAFLLDDEDDEDDLPLPMRAIDPSELAGAAPSNPSSPKATVKDLPLSVSPFDATGALKPKPEIQKKSSSTPKISLATMMAKKAGSTSKTNDASSSSVLASTSATAGVVPTKSKKIIASTSATTVKQEKPTKEKPAKSQPVASTSTTTTPNDQSAWMKLYDSQLRDLFENVRSTKTPLSLATRLARGLALFSFDPTKEGVSPWGDHSGIPPSGRLQVMTQLLERADATFWKALLDTPSDDALKVFKNWLWGASAREVVATGSNKKSETKVHEKANELGVTLLPVLKVFAKLPLTIDHIKTYELGRRMVKIQKGSTDEDVSNLAKRLIFKWQGLAEAAAGKEDGGKSEAKRRMTDAAADVPSKKVKTATTTPMTATVKKPSATPAASSSSATAKKPAVVPTVLAKKPPAPVNNPMQNLLASMSFNKRASAVIPVGPAVGPAAPGPSGTSLTPAAGRGASSLDVRLPLSTAKKEKKKVHWPVDDLELKKVRFIENRDQLRDLAMPGYGGQGNEGVDENEGFESLVKDMNEREGAAMTQNAAFDMEEEIDWGEPLPIWVPEGQEFDAYRAPIESAEAAHQAEREADVAEYVFDENDPESQMQSPLEPPPHVGTDDDTLEMAFSVELLNDADAMRMIASAQASRTPTNGYLQDDQLQSLLGNLVSFNNEQQHQLPAQAGPSNGGAPTTGVLDEQALAKLMSFDPAMIQNYVHQHPEQLGMLANELNQRATFPGTHIDPNPTPYANTMPSWASSQIPVSRPAMSTMDHYNGYVPPVPSSSNNFGAISKSSSNRGAKSGKGKGKFKTIPCKFFNSNRGCDMGRNCRFLHDLAA